ncbi:hypothetical protein BZL35_00378 [Candidatus Pandoraea novymonadis]|uniref:Uncharacterized protein n=1 Tax=Candidatus Pandoraea novymonadis TaxID=1808959 RepID=A0ABX5FGR8_9BURK|nr:hypothetical protein BZL35_00378 [Candidatus Pandoraea novymonadis]
MDIFYRSLFKVIEYLKIQPYGNNILFFLNIVDESSNPVLVRSAHILYRILTGFSS